MRCGRRGKPHPHARGKVVSQRIMSAPHADEDRSIEGRFVFDFDFHVGQYAERGEMLQRRGRLQRDARDRRARLRRTVGK